MCSSNAWMSYSSYCEVANLNSRLDPLVVGIGLGGGVRNVLPDDASWKKKCSLLIKSEIVVNSRDRGQFTMAFYLDT